MDELTHSGAVGGTRTPTGVTPQRPQRCASTNSATTAFEAWCRVSSEERWGRKEEKCAAYAGF